MISVEASRRVVALNPPFALRTDASGKFMEDVVGLLFDPGLAFVCGFDQVASFYSWLTKR